MFRRILVPIDRTPRGAESIAIARQLARQAEARITLLRVEPTGASETEIAADQRELSQLATELRAEGLDAHALLEYDEPGTPGGPGTDIAATARAQRSDIIVMAPRHRGFLESLRHPSVTAQLFSRSPAPLLIWPEQMRDDAPEAFLDTVSSLVIVPLDGSKLAEEALPVAETFAREYDRTLVLVCVVPHVVLAGGGPETLRLQHDAQADAERETLHYLRRTRRHLAHTVDPQQLTVQTMLRTGDAAHELLALAQSHPDSLLVMSTHGRGAVMRALAGSVATALMQHTPIPMVVVPPRAWEHQADMPATSETQPHPDGATH